MTPLEARVRALLADTRDEVLAWCWDVDPGGHDGGGCCRIEVWLPELELGGRAGNLLMEATQDRVDAVLAREVERES